MAHCLSSLQQRRSLFLTMPRNSINITSVSSDIGSVYAGKSRAPEAFRAAGLQRNLERAGFTVTETAGNVAQAVWTSSSREPNGARNEMRTVQACQAVRESVLSSLQRSGPEDTVQLILSGECLYMPAILSAYVIILVVSERRLSRCSLFTLSCRLSVSA